MTEKVLFGLRVRLAPRLEHRRTFSGASGASRVAFNWALAVLRDQHSQWAQQRAAGVPAEQRVKVPSAFDLKKRWVLERDHVAPWHQQYASKIYEQAIDDARTAYGRFLEGRSRFPKFKNRHSPRRFRLYMNVDLRPGVVQIPRVGDVHIARPSVRQAEVRRLLRRGRAKIKNVTVSQDATGEWWASLLIERTITWQPEQQATDRANDVEPAQVRRPWLVGTDVGISNLLTAADSSGTVLQQTGRRRRQDRQQAKVIKMQRRLSRQDRTHAHATGAARIRSSPSKGRATTKRQLARAHRKLAWARTSQTHQATAELVARINAVARERDLTPVVVLETLNVKGMSAAGGVRKRGLNRHLADASLGELLRQLSYKLGDNRVLRAPRWYASSSTCSACGHRHPGLRLSDRTWTCTFCAAVHDRDVNAATNLAAWGEQHLRGLRIQDGDRPVGGPSAPARVHAREGARHGRSQRPQELTIPAPREDAAGIRRPAPSVLVSDLGAPGQGATARRINDKP